MSQHDPVWPGGRSPTWWTRVSGGGDIGVAEDMARGIFPLAAGPGRHIDDERGWLIVVTSRLRLDHIVGVDTPSAPHDTMPHGTTATPARVIGRDLA